MYTEFDYNDDKSRLEYKFEKFFGDFSAEARRRLMAKNMIKPVSLYDVFYPSVKTELLTKNVKLINTDLDEFSQSIRDAQLAKTIEKVFSLEEQSEDFRKSLLARAKMQKDITELIDSALEKRKDLLSKNKVKDGDLLDDTASYRKNNLSANRKDASEELSESKLQEYYRTENLSKITSKESTLEENSSVFRSDDLSNNSTLISNLEGDSIVYRNKGISYNVPKEINLETGSIDFRKDDLANNKTNGADLLEDSSIFRSDDLSNNSTLETDLVEDSKDFRKDDLALNTPKGTDLVVGSQEFRKDDLALNTPKGTDLVVDSREFRKDDLALNTPKETDLATDSIMFREGDLSSNTQKENDLVVDSQDFRNDDLSYNTPIEGDLAESGLVFRNDDLSNNTTITTDLEAMSSSFRNDDLSNNTPIETDLEEVGMIYRNEDLSYNTPIDTDLENDSATFRSDDLSYNTPIDTDLEVDSTPYRDGDLSNNTPINTDLEVDSVPFRDGDLSNNTTIVTDLETDSEVFRIGDLSYNTPINTDLEVDSVPFRDGDLSNNTSINTDLEVDSVPFRTGDLANNTAINTDLEVDSVPFRDGDMSNNVPVNTDLEADSVLFRTGDLSYNVPISINLYDDSAPFRNDDLANNVDTTYTIDRHIDAYGGLSTATVEKNHLLKSNARSEDSLDGFYDQYGNPSSSKTARDNNLAKNVGGGMLGFNVMAFGQSQYVGISGVWAQGLLFRNLLLLRNKPGGFFYDGEDTNIDKFYSITTGMETTVKNIRIGNVLGQYSNKYKGIRNYVSIPGISRDEYDMNGTLLQDTLTVPNLGQIQQFEALPMNPVDTINQTAHFINHISSIDITSPIERNLTVAYNNVINTSIETEFRYGIDGRDLDGGSVGKRKVVDYSLDNGFDFSAGLVSTLEFGKSSYSNNVNSMMREFLKSMSFYSLDDKGNLALTPRQAGEVSEMAAKFASLQGIIKADGTPGSNSVAELISHYKMFNVDRLNRIMKSRNSVVSPSGQNYLAGDAEKMFDNDYGNLDNKSIAFKKFLGNPTDDSQFSITKSKGVKNVIKRIASDSSIEFSQNYQNIQGPATVQQGENAQPLVYVVGKDKGKKELRQKFSLRNPYAPQGAGKLIFYLKNYAIPNTEGSLMYFPPYIQSFQNSDSASWNSNNFLGRPEAVYTYNNSSRDGSITFFVLTDYAEEVVLGRYQTGNMRKMTANINKDFSKGDLGLLGSVSQALESEISDKIKKISELTKKEEENKEQTNATKTLAKSAAGAASNKEIDEKGTQPGDNTEDESLSEKEKLYKEKQQIEKALGDAEIKAAQRNYSEATADGTNVYNLETHKFNTVNGETTFGAGETLERVESMIRNLSFQPAYFSGSLTDFKNRMEFLSKLTRPAGNDNHPKTNTGKGGGATGGGGSGFSFTKPPVCHLRLGDWYDHDVIINSVSFDYTDAPWTVGASKTQPMWVSVSIQFNIIGPAGVEGGVPLTATDTAGYYGRGSF